MLTAGVGGGWNQHQQQGQQQPRFMSPSNTYGAVDPRQAMQNNFVRSPPPSQPVTPGVNDAYGGTADPYAGYDAYDQASVPPASPANVYAPAPQRLPQQHPASLTPGFLHEPRDASGGSGSVYYDAAAGPSTGGGQPTNAVAGGSSGVVVEPPSYELSSIAPGQTDTRQGGGGYPREKGGYQPSTPGR